jgi:deazaflavin-dependent oxidoreductase (nitroreductase family)
MAYFNRRVTNRLTRPFARWLPGFGIVVHEGRRSKREYRTPVNVFRVPDGYVVALTYGTESEWIRNVRTAGGCELITRGTRTRVGSPEIRAAGSSRHSSDPCCGSFASRISCTSGLIREPDSRCGWAHAHLERPLDRDDRRREALTGGRTNTTSARSSPSLRPRRAGSSLALCGAPMRLTTPGRSVQAPARRRTHYTPRHGATGSASARICGSWRYGIGRHSNAHGFERSVTRISQSGTIEGAARPLPS